MATLCLLLAACLMLTIVAGMWRIFRGPTAADRMMSAQLFGTTAVGTLLLLAEAQGADALRDVALVFALLAAVTAVVFVRRTWTPSVTDHDPR